LSPTEVLAQYADKCLQHLQIKCLNSSLALFIVRIVTMANVFTIDIANYIQRYIKTCDLMSLVEQERKLFQSGKVATYMPAVLQNIVGLSRKQGVQPEILAQRLVHTMKWVQNVLMHSEAEITNFSRITKDVVAQLVNNKFELKTNLNENGEVEIEAEQAVRVQQGRRCLIL
jgi:hypothetical protein